MAKLNCPIDCQDKHRKTEVNMAEIKKDLTYIKEKLDENTRQHDDLMELIKDMAKNKADKTELDRLNAKFWIATTSLIGLLIAFIFWFLNR